MNIDKNPAVKVAKLKMKFYVIIFLLFFFFIIGIVLLFVINSVSDKSDYLIKEEEEEEIVPDNYVTAGIAPEVTRYEKYFEKYAKEQGIGEHADVLMAMAMQESGGRYLDVMQSSESLGMPVNSLTDPKKSIEQGVKYFSEVLDQAGGDVELALQAYNMGNGFIDYVEEHNDGKYSKGMAVRFSNMMANRMRWSRYGDVNYVDNVMQYLEQDNTIPVKGSGNWKLPLKEIIVTSGFGARTHPITGEVESFHGGVDFGCTPQDDIRSVKSGEVVEAIHSNIGYGNYVTLKHGENEFSRYGHMSSLNVSVGDKVSQGGSVGKCGTTGSSTGNHLHLEHMTELGQAHPDKIDPRKTLGLEID